MIRIGWLLALVACTVPKGEAAPPVANSDVRWVGDRLVIGQPRGLLGRDDGGDLVVRHDRKLVVADHDGWIGFWDSTTGIIQREMEPPSVDEVGVMSLAISPDGKVLAIGGGDRVRVLRAPFEKVALELRCHRALAFSHDSKLLACGSVTPEIWSVVDGKQVVPKSPRGPSLGMASGVFSSDDHSVYWVTDNDLLRWDFATTGKVTSLLESAEHINAATFSANGKLAVINAMQPKTFDVHAMLVDLASGTTVDLPNSSHAALAADGSRVAVSATSEVRVLDTASKQVVWSTKTTEPMTRIRFAETSDVLAFTDGGGRIHVANLPAQPTTYDAPSRFAGWVSEGVAAFDRSGALNGFALVDKRTVAVDRAALPRADVRPANAPAWATWIASGVAAEATERHATPLDDRADTPCPSRLRVWTPTGGIKTLVMSCSKTSDRVDPGWELGGGWALGISATIATLHDPKSGKQVAAFAIEPPRVDQKDFEHAFWTAAVAPSLVALISHGPKLANVGLQGHDDPKPSCAGTPTVACVHEWFVSIWDTKGALVSRTPIGADKPSGPIVFDHAQKHVLVGFENGDVDVLPTSTEPREQHHRVHHHRIVRIVVSPSDGWVFSEDAAGEQRIWRLPP